MPGGWTHGLEHYTYILGGDKHTIVCWGVTGNRRNTERIKSV